MDSIQASEYQIDNYYILVKKTSRFTTLEELNGHSVAVYDDGSENYEKAFGMLKEKVSLTATDWGSVTNAVNATINGSSDSLFIKSSLTESLSEFMDNFSIDNFNILDTIEIKTEITTTADSNINISEDSFNIFISGIDTYGTISTVARSDVNMIVTVNPRTHTVLLTSIPRDFYVQLHGTTGLKDKLTHAGLYGINMSINTIQDLFGIKIDYYIRVNFDSTIKLIDALGGIDITPDFTFSRKTNGIYCSYEKGRVNHLDGFCALRYARERKAYGAGDLHRIQNQQEVLVAIIDKLTSSKVLLARYTDILSSLSGTLETNIPSSQIYKLVNNQLDTMPSWKIERIATTGTHIDAPTYTFGSQLLYVFVPDMESVAKAAKKIEAVMSAN
ncbi:LCP family protein [Candidatus Saccharibacteria bacterium]|nr:LCP family protein [Candidatus Saccharibacteria bacterium]